MTDIVSMPVVSPSKFLSMKQEAKSTLMEDMNLDKAANLSAQRSVLLNAESIPSGLKEAQLKQLNRKINYWTKRVRQPFADSETDLGGPGIDTETDVGPAQALVSALIKTIKHPATPAKATVATPVNKPKHRPWDYLTPKETPPIRPAKKKAEKALGGYQEPGRSTPLALTNKYQAISELDKAHSAAVAKGKQPLKKQAKNKGKEVGVN